MYILSKTWSNIIEETQPEPVGEVVTYSVGGKSLLSLLMMLCGWMLVGVGRGLCVVLELCTGVGRWFCLGSE